MEEQKKKYKHIFDFFNEKGEWVGGAEPETDSTKMPMLTSYGGVIPSYVVYLGWCEIEEANFVYSGHCFEDNMMRNNETKQLISIKETITYENGVTVTFHKDSKHKGSATYEDDCKFLGIELRESYVRLKKEREDKFKSEWKKVINNKEYFREKYYREEKKL